MSLCSLFLMNLPSAPGGSASTAPVVVAVTARMTLITLTDRISLVV